MVDDRVPRSLWPLSGVTDVRKNSKDGHVRSVMANTRISTLDRPVDKIVLLEPVQNLPEEV